MAPKYRVGVSRTGITLCVSAFTTDVSSCGLGQAPTMSKYIMTQVSTFEFTLSSIAIQAQLIELPSLVCWTDGEIR